MDIETIKKNLQSHLGLCLWLVLVGSGLASLWLYSMDPGGFGVVADHWPEQSELQLASKPLQLIMFVHPQCTCSRASIGELAVLMKRKGEAMDAKVIFICPEDRTLTWVQSSLWQEAKRIPGVVVSVDQGGKEAALFGAETSGATIVYGADGQLIFHGGITAARGHFGDNVGRLSIEKIVEGNRAVPETTPVFGCALLNQTELSANR